MYDHRGKSRSRKETREQFVTPRFSGSRAQRKAWVAGAGRASVVARSPDPATRPTAGLQNFPSPLKSSHHPRENNSATSTRKVPRQSSLSGASPWWAFRSVGRASICDFSGRMCGRTSQALRRPATCGGHVDSKGPAAACTKYLSRCNQACVTPRQCCAICTDLPPPAQ